MNSVNNLLNNADYRQDCSVAEAAVRGAGIGLPMGGRQDSCLQHNNRKQNMAAKAAMAVAGSRTTALDRREVLSTHRRYWVIRRAQDVFFSLLALVILSPVMIITALAIWIDDPHASPIFSQMRCGRDGKEFRIYKFRSMYADAEQRLSDLLKDNEMDGPAFKMKNDPRITRVGNFIRKTSIDELPQLVNIIRGDMSIVGPRPALPREVALYEPWQRQRMYVQPGLTCYWQIQPERNNISFDEWMALDLMYIRERSFLTDWKIILMTVRAVLLRQGE